MQTRSTYTSALRAALTASVVAAGLSACAPWDMKGSVAQVAQDTRKGPESAPQRTITNFSDAMRCMDSQLITYGIRDVSILAEELDDKTKKISAGTKDMLISAVSSMTRRSRAIRLVAFGLDSRSLDEWIRRSQSLAPFAEVPQFAIRGSVSQFDQSIARKEGDIGIAYNDKWSLGAARNAGVSRMAVDLNMIFGANFSIVPGVTSQNSVVLFNEGAGVDGDATIKKFGINFSMTLSKSEGPAQALRNLVDLATIELVGRLTRTPYWLCLGSRADVEEVKKETEDWYYSMAASGELVPYIQYQLRNRGYFGGALDGQPSAGFTEAVSAYRVAMGGEPGRGEVDEEFLQRYWGADHAAVLAKSPAPAKVPGADAAPVANPSTNASASSAATPTAPIAGANATAAGSQRSSADSGEPVNSSIAASRALGSGQRLNLSIESVSGEQIFGRGQPIQLAIVANRQAHLHCFMRDDRRQFQRIFPNRFNRDTLMRPGEALHLPGQMRFQILASPRGIAEAVVCYATDRDVIAQLPRRISGADFENLPIVSFDEIKNAFRGVTNDQFAEGVFHVRTQ